MRLRDLIKFSADYLSPGAAHAPVVRHQAVSTHLKKVKVKTRPALALAPGLRADASPSDMASHKTWQEPSTSDVTIKNWRAKRLVEKIKRRNLDPFEEVLAATGPCGCTLKLGERVTVDEVGRGKIKSRKDRMLTVALDNGKSRTIDQKFVHRLL